VIHAREKAGLDRKALADALSLDLNSYGHYERGRYAFTVDQLFVLSHVLHRSVPWLLGLETDLSEDEDRLLTLYRSAPPGAKEMVLATVEAMVTAAKQ
jgi:transcriptional regulator with XRE-family HTH domain